MCVRGAEISKFEPKITFTEIFKVKEKQPSNFTTENARPNSVG